jgi:hypothetical protein
MLTPPPIAQFWDTSYALKDEALSSCFDQVSGAFIVIDVTRPVTEIRLLF